MGKIKDYLPNKYKFRKEQILHLIILSGEIPSTLYNDLFISRSNFSSVISRLSNEGFVKSIKGNSLTGYVLTSDFKNRIIQSEKYKEYRNEITNSSTDIQKRRRMRTFAAAYAMFDYLGIVYENFRKPQITNDMLNEKKSEMAFYTAKEFKQTQPVNGITIIGSKSYGLMIGHKCVIPLYITRYDMQTYTSVEFKFIRLVEAYFKAPCNAAILLSDNENSIISISKSIINNEVKGKDITDYGYYNNLYLIKKDKHTKLQFWLLYNSQSIEDKLKKQFCIESKETYMVNDGYIENKPVLFMLNYDVARLKAFLIYVGMHSIDSYIICFDYMFNALKTVSEHRPVSFIKIKSEKIERRIESERI